MKDFKNKISEAANSFAHFQVTTLNAIEEALNSVKIKTKRYTNVFQQAINNAFENFVGRGFINNLNKDSYPDRI